jgi:hypothetical protein
MLLFSEELSTMTILPENNREQKTQTASGLHERAHPTQHHGIQRTKVL